MKTPDIICVCPLCLDGIRDGIRQAFELYPGRPLGAFTIRVLAGFGWVPWLLYSHLLGRMVEAGEVVKFVPDSPNDPTRYLLARHLPPPRALAELERRPPRGKQQRQR